MEYSEVIKGDGLRILGEFGVGGRGFEGEMWGLGLGWGRGLGVLV